MAREKSEERIKAEQIYLEAKGEIKLVDIAERLGVTDTKIRKWKCTDKWDDKLKGNVPLKESNTKRERSIKSKTKSKKKKEPISEEVRELLEDDELSDKHKMFCMIYSKKRNATKAYQEVYHCTYWTAAVEGNRLLKKPQIKKHIDSLFEADLNKEFLKKSLIQQYKDIASSDIRDYLEWGTKQEGVWTKNEDGEFIPVIDPDTGEQRIRNVSYVRLKDTFGVDTSLIQEISEGRDGIKIKLESKMKAMEVLAKLSNLLSDEEKTKLDIEQRKINLLKSKAEIDKIKAETGRIVGEEEPEIEDDGFIEALQGKVPEVWGNGET